VWDVVGKYLRSGRMFQEHLGTGVTLRGVDGNPGVAG
jgi:sulfur-oxidizing protein SoxB